ncbi:MAG: Stk1 family PASTA domain-containing Ser/Thr kinase [Clostridiales bacterium]|jgi:serine/threonine-protein kinase|nr:Stk1 family PASTA domain-containing Ser/Thr kinase [Clostridiales bacterium]
MILNPGAIISNRYEIVDELGSGGMSIVYRAVDKKLDRFVTFKVMREEFIKDADFIQRFNIEARAAASLSHPNIVNVYDVGQDGGIYYIVMEFIDGYTLKALIDKKAPFENKEIIGVSIQIAKALQNAHQNNIVHRDIKPENIMITNKGIVKVTDFGIARAATSSTITVDSTMGSVYYFSPEQARGGFVDLKSDIYSLGIVMFEMATNNLPFNGENTVAIALKHLHDEVPDIKAMNPNITDSIAKVIYKATQKKSINRYESASTLIVDLKLSLNDDSGDFVYVKDENNVSKETIRISGEEINRIKTESDSYEGEKREIQAIKRKSGESSEDKEYKKQYKTTIERRVIGAAVITSILIILMISFFIIKYLDSIKKTVVMPEELDRVVGVSETEANNILNQLGIDILDTKWVHSDTVESGFVVSYDIGIDEDTSAYPVAGESKIVLHISNGPELIEVRSFIGQNYNLIDDMITESELTKDITHSHINSDEPKDIIIDQSPKAGDHVEKGTRIKFTISDGPPIQLVAVQSYRNYEREDARAEIEALGLEVEFEERYNDFYEEGRVVSQSIDAGRTVKVGEVIILIISLGPEADQAATPNTGTVDNGGGETAATEIIEKEGYLEINYEGFEEGQETATIRVLEIHSGIGTEIFENTFTRDDLPYLLEVSGTGAVDYMFQVLKDGQYIKYAEASVDFDEIIID